MVNALNNFQNLESILDSILIEQNKMVEKMPCKQFDNGSISYSLETAEYIFTCQRAFLFFTFAKYLNLFSLDDSDVTINSCLHSLGKEKILDIWLELSRKLKKADFESIKSTINLYDLRAYQNSINDKILFDFCVTKYIDRATALNRNMREDTDLFWNSDLAVMTMINCSSVFSLSLNNLNICIKGISQRLLVYLLSHLGTNCHWYLSGMHEMYKLYFYLLELLHSELKVTFLEDNKIQYDSNTPILYDLLISSDEEDTFDKIIQHIKPLGYCILNEQKCTKSSFLSLIDSHTIHLMCNSCYFDNNKKFVLLIQKKNPTQEKIRYLYMFNEFRPLREDSLQQSIISEYEDLILERKKNYHKYQVLPVTDFFYAKDEAISFRNISREEDEMNFKWFKISDIFQINEELYECNTLIPQNKVFTHDVNKEFQFDLPDLYYIENNEDESNNFNPSEYHHYLYIMKNDEGNLVYSYSDFGIVCRVFGLDSSCDTIEDKRINQVALQRTLINSCYLAENNNFYKVNASESKFVNYYRYGISFDEYENIDGLYDIAVPCMIDSSFHDYCVMYLMHKHNKGLEDKAILLPATKELQEKYYYLKQFEYLKNNPQEILKFEQRVHTKQVPQSNIQSIGFQNFRKFKTLPLLRLNDVTMFVGANNSGKSTVVRGLLLILDNLRTMNIMDESLFQKPLFRFDAKDFHDANISVFKRALYDNANSDTIQFYVNLSEFLITISITGDRLKTQTTAPVSCVEIVDTVNKIKFKFDFIANIQSLTAHDIVYETSLSQSLNYVNQNIFSSYMKSFMEENEVNNDDTGMLASYFLKVNESATRFEYVTKSIAVEYISAHAATQNILYNTADKNDYMAQTIHDFVSLDLEHTSEEVEFIKSWMSILGIGVDFKITNIAGEAFTLEITNENAITQYLADKGIGSNQLMILLLKIATIVNKYSHTKIKPIIIIEEPEQNLHPALQSKLTDLFYEVSSRYKVKFIIETHSEYVIRRSQVIVSQIYNTEEKLNMNPFTVYYFPDEDLPYDMKYTSFGRFEEQFGEGFFDAASKLNLQLPRIERRR